MRHWVLFSLILWQTIAESRTVRFSFGDFPETGIKYRRFTLSLTNLGTAPSHITVNLFDKDGTAIAVASTIWKLETWNGSSFQTFTNGDPLPAKRVLLITVKGNLTLLPFISAKNPSYGEITVTESTGALIGQGTMWAFLNDSLQHPTCVSGYGSCCTRGVGSFANWERSIFINGGRPF